MRATKNLPWLKARNIDQLKALGPFRSVREAVEQSLGGKRWKLKAKGWKQLFEAVSELRRFAAKSVDLPSSTDQREADPSGWHSDYFKSRDAEIIYALLEESDDQKKEKYLGYDRSHYYDACKAKEWRDRVALIIHPDKTSHPQANAATSELNYLYSRMRKNAK